MVVFEGDI